MINPDIAPPPGYHHNCPLCGFPLHFSCRFGSHHCYGCGTDWELDDLLEAIEYDEY